MNSIKRQACGGCGRTPENGRMTRHARRVRQKEHQIEHYCERWGWRGRRSNRTRNHRNNVRALASRKNGSDIGLDLFLSRLDPRGDSELSQAVRLALAASGDSRFGEFLKRLYRSRYARSSVGAIARSCDLTLGDFLEFWGDAQVDHAIYRACVAAPAIVRDVVQNALSAEVVCRHCDGLRKVDVDAAIPPEFVPGYLGRLGDHSGRVFRVCPMCGGKGTVTQPGNEHARDRLLEIAGLIGNVRLWWSITTLLSIATHPLSPSLPPQLSTWTAMSEA